MLVREVMSTGVLTAKKTDTLRSVVIKMLSRHCGAIPVIEDDGKLVGLVSVRDVMIPLFPNYGDYVHDNVHSRDFVEMEEGYADVLKKTVADVMSTNPLTVSPDDPILEAASYGRRSGSSPGRAGRSHGSARAGGRARCHDRRDRLLS